MQTSRLALPGVDAAEMHARVMEGLRRMPQLFRGCRIVRFDGGEGSVTPGSPDRSLANAVIYEPGASIEAAYEELARTYREAGVNAWTVWVPDEDRATAEFLSARDHVLDATPRAMAASLEGFGAAPREGDNPPSLEEIAVVNEAAYGYAAGDFGRIMSGELAAGWRSYAIRDERGMPVSVVLTDRWDSNCDVTLVATHPDHRGHGHAGGLILLALQEAREEGLETTTLVATRAGQPLYERLGYRDIGGLEMWELRRPASA